MKWWPILGFLVLMLASGASIAKSDTQVVVPIQFNIVTDLPMTKDGLVMDSWVSEADIRETVLPEINCIWAPSGVSFTVQKIRSVQSLTPDNKPELVDYIVQASRDASGKSNPERIRKLNQLIDWSEHSETAINVYLVPYLGQTSQGNARRKSKRIFVGQYSDKSSHATQAPQPVKLTEGRPFQIGSLSRTLAHEIGHVLRLKHPDKKIQTDFGLLMGGKKQGYHLRQEDKNTALKAAQKLVAE